jgi:hypothetical protein
LRKHDLNMGLPENVPTATNSFVILAVLCLLLFGGIAFAEFMQRREKAKPGGVKIGCAMSHELAEKFPKLMLQASQLPTGEWIIASPTKPLTQDEAETVVVAYQTIQELVARGSGPVEH